MNAVKWLTIPEPYAQIKLELFEFEGKQCVVISGVSLDELEQNPELGKAIKEKLSSTVETIKKQDWNL